MNEEDPPLWKSFKNKSTAVDEEFDNFMVKVQEVKKLMEGLASQDKTVANETLKAVDNYLGDPDSSVNIDDREGGSRVATCKTVINQKAFDSMTNDPSQQETQSPEAFMKSCEEDAKRRAEERRLQKECSDTFKKQAISAFRKGEYEKALSFYNKAINEFRGSALLYTSRALTCLKLNLYKRTIEDCGLVLRCFDEKSLKVLLYKAKALQSLGEEEEATKCVEDAIKYHPKSEDDIREYMNKDLDTEK